MMNNAPWLSKYGKGCRGENCGRGRQHGNWRMGFKVFTYRIVFFNIYNRQYLNSICIDKNLDIYEYIFSPPQSNLPPQDTKEGNSNHLNEILKLFIQLKYSCHEVIKIFTFS